jgi:hypothetical protein
MAVSSFNVKLSTGRQAPGEAERSAILGSLLASKQLAPDFSIIDLARRTAAFVAGDLASLVIRTSYAAIARVMQAVYVHLAVLAFPLVINPAL